MDVFNTFQLKLKQLIQKNRQLENEIKEMEKRIKQKENERQRMEELYNSESKKCQKLNDLMFKKETDFKIESEKKFIELNEEKNLYLSQIEIINKQMETLKQHFIDIQNKNSISEENHFRKNKELENQINIQMEVETQLIDIRTKMNSFREDMKSLSETQIRIKEMVQSLDHLNYGKKEMDSLNKQLIDSNNENSILKTLVSELREKCRQTEELINESELQSLRLTQRNDLQKQEIDELKKHLNELYKQNECLAKQINNKTNFNYNELTETHLNLNTESDVQTIGDKPLVTLKLNPFE